MITYDEKISLPQNNHEYSKNATTKAINISKNSTIIVTTYVGND
ncbi:MAG: hypothetical protein PWP15_915 [Methanothermococcus sp.]|jgi:hypothetical protein|nr:MULTISPECIES: hypothetical protein [Methanococcaceae]MDK2790408.1 hypothetical protein [Methanothermococcus sp.]MDK2987481.1 hypothetical protein [Methanothermococcus sp.]